MSCVHSVSSLKKISGVTLRLILGLILVLFLGLTSALFLGLTSTLFLGLTSELTLGLTGSRLIKPFNTAWATPIDPALTTPLSPKHLSPKRLPSKHLSPNSQSIFPFKGSSRDREEASKKRKKKLTSWLSKYALHSDPWVRFSVLMHASRWRDHLSQSFVDHLFESVQLSAKKNVSAPGHLNTSRLWIQYDQAIKTRRLKQAQKIARQFVFLRDAWISAHPINPRLPLQREQWRLNPKVFDQVGLISQKSDPNHQELYALWSFKSSRARAAYVHIGHSTEIQGWLNGEVLDPFLSKDRLWVDQDTWPVQLRAGVNVLMIRLTQVRSEVVVRLSDTHSRLLQLKTAPVPWGKPLQAAQTLAPPAFKGEWEKTLQRLDQHPKSFSDEALLGIAHYLKLNDLKTHRTTLFMEVHHRWESAPSLIYSEILRLIIDPRYHLEFWETYSLPHLKKEHTEVEAQRHCMLWLTRIQDYLLRDQVHQIFQWLRDLQDLYPLSVQWTPLWVNWFKDLGAPNSGLAILEYALQYWREDRTLLNAYARTLAQMGRLKDALKMSEKVLYRSRGLWSHFVKSETPKHISPKHISINFVEDLLFWFDLKQQLRSKTSREKTSREKTSKETPLQPTVTTQQESTSIDQNLEDQSLEDRVGDFLFQGPRGWSVYLSVLHHLLERKDWDKFQSLIKRSPIPDHPEILLLSARSSLDHGEVKEAKRLIKDALKGSPDYQEAIELSKELEGRRARPRLGPSIKELRVTSWRSRGRS